MGRKGRLKIFISPLRRASQDGRETYGTRLGADREATARLSCLAPLQTISLLLQSLSYRRQVSGDHLIGQVQMAVPGYRKKASGGRSPEGNSLVFVKGGQTFDFTLPTRLYPSGRVNCLKGHPSTLSKGTWMLETTKTNVIELITSAPTSYLQLHPRCSFTFRPTQTFWCGFNTYWGLRGPRVEGMEVRRGVRQGRQVEGS